MKEYILKEIKRDKKGLYHLVFEDSTLVINEDIYTDYFLYANKILSEDEYNEILNRSNKMDGYAYIFRLLKERLYSSYQLKEKLINKKNIKPYIAKQIIQEFIDKGIIDDKRYTTEKIESLELKNYGYYRIKDTLYQEGIDIEKYDYYLDDDKENKKIKELVPILMKKFSSSSGTKMKESIYHSLINFGFDEKTINRELSNINSEDLRKNDKENLKKKYLLITLKYSKEDKKFYKDEIIDKLKRNGYRYSDIIETIEEYEDE